MKQILSALLLLTASSLHAQYNYYFGNIHAHSNYSDGNKDSSTTGFFTPADDYNYAKGSYHMDFLGIAEHNHFSSTRNPGMRLANYAKGLYQADTATHDGSFVCLYGMEWGVISNGGHVVTYGVPSLIGWETGSGGWGPTNNYDIYCAKSDYTSFWPIVNSFPNSFCTLAHPDNGDYGDLNGAAAYSTVADSAIVGVAVRSGSAMSLTTDYSDPAPTSYESDFLATLAKGYHAGPAADQDNHYTTFGRTNHIRTVVLAQSLKKDSIMAAYRAMRFYASDDWNAQVSFTVNGNVMGSNFNTAANSSISVSINDPSNNSGGADPINKIQIYYGVPGSGSNATLLTSNTGSNSLAYVHSTSLNSSYYYFAKITQVDGDIVWTSPIWIFRNSLTLPVDLLNFTAAQSKQQVQVKWTTAQEINNDRFEVERSIDGSRYETIAVVASRDHNSQTPTSYFFDDRLPKAGMNFYRLRQIDLDGRASYSNIVAVNFENEFVKLRISPNPATNNIIVSYPLPAPDIFCKIYNSEGREVMQLARIAATNNIDISRLPAGMYFVVLARPDERLAEGNFIKQ